MVVITQQGEICTINLSYKDPNKHYNQMQMLAMKNTDVSRHIIIDLKVTDQKDTSY